MTIQPNPSQVKKDLEAWAKKLREVDKLVREIYLSMNEVYKDTMEVTNK